MEFLNKLSSLKGINIPVINWFCSVQKGRLKVNEYSAVSESYKQKNTKKKGQKKHEDGKSIFKKVRQYTKSNFLGLFLDQPFLIGA